MSTSYAVFCLKKKKPKPLVTAAAMWLHATNDGPPARASSHGTGQLAGTARREEASGLHHPRDHRAAPPHARSTLSLHDALPILAAESLLSSVGVGSHHIDGRTEFFNQVQMQQVAVG